MATSINTATDLINDLIESLESAYWETSECVDKDRIFDVMRVLTKEYIELMKISIQDQHYPYETISINQATLQGLLSEFQQNLETIRRHTTRQSLRNLLNQFATALPATN